MNDIEPGYACSDLNEFNALLLRWLSDLTDKTVAGELGFKKDYITVPIGGVDCGLSGDTTRDGVTDYLIALEFDEPTFSVIANQKGVVNRVVIGEHQQPIPGFYLYAQQPLAAPTTLEDSEWPRGVIAVPDASQRPSESVERASHDPDAGSLILPELTTMPAASLFSLQGALIAELRSREILRTNNPPVGDYAEWLVAKALGGVPLEINSAKAYDLVAEPYGRVQVKARVLSSPERSGQRQTGAFRSEDFDHAALVLVSDVDFSVEAAVLLPVSVIKDRWNWRQHVKGWTLMMNNPTLTHPSAIDIADDLRRAARSLH